eukprot:8008801-Pyramimonas_sp.AAC.1
MSHPPTPMMTDAMEAHLLLEQFSAIELVAVSLRLRLVGLRDDPLVAALGRCQLGSAGHGCLSVVSRKRMQPDLGLGVRDVRHVLAPWRDACNLERRVSGAAQAHLDAVLVDGLDVQLVASRVVENVQFAVGLAAEQSRHGAAHDAHTHGEGLAVHRAGNQRRLAA